MSDFLLIEKKEKLKEEGEVSNVKGKLYLEIFHGFDLYFCFLKKKKKSIKHYFILFPSFANSQM